MKRSIVFIFIAGLLGVVIWQLAGIGARAYERMTVNRVAGGLEVLGYDWVKLKSDGLRIEIHGHAPDTFARELALESARATAPMARVVSYATATLAPPERRDPVRVELLRDESGITMTGQTSSRAMRQRLDAELAARAPGVAFHDLTGIQAAPPPRGWGEELDVATLAAGALANALIVMEPGRVEIDGEARDAADRDLLIAALRRAAGDRVLVVPRIRIPTPVIAPFTFSAVKEAGRGILIESCAVRDGDEQARLRKVLVTLGPNERMALCTVGLGGPSRDWPGAIEAGIDALQRLDAGRFDLEYGAARLIATPPTPPESFREVAEDLRAGLPEGFVLNTVRDGTDVALDAEIGRDLYWLRVRLSPLGVSIAGQIPDRMAETAITAYATALFGKDRVVHDLTVVDRAPPADWQIAVLAMLDQLALATRGEVEMAGYRTTLRATLAEPALSRQIHAELAEGLPDYAVTTVFEIDLPAEVARIPLPGPRCAADLNQVLEDRPIEFTTGSARITPESAHVLDALSRILAGCNDDQIEVGGHTDSQGSDSVNERVSQARAEAVREALLDRSIARDRLVAHGYGEAHPIADNETEEGRTRNRRIEFRAIPQLPARSAEAED